MVRIEPVKNAREKLEDLISEGYNVDIEFYKNGTSWHTDFVGEFIEDNLIIPDGAVCSFLIMNKEDYETTLFANCSYDIDTYFDDLDYIIVVNVQTDENDDFIKY